MNTNLPELHSCVLCPRKCYVDRASGQCGYCGENAELRVGRAALHFWEEPCISGTCGSGTVFFAGCSLRCVYCQNYDLIRSGGGVPVTEERLAAIFLELEKKGAANINLVTPDHFIPQILPALKSAKKEGLTLPVVWNLSGYETVAQLQMIEEFADIYLTDLKYLDADLASAYSSAPDYPETARAALAEMVRQQPVPVFDEAGMMKKGVIVRHLLLPGHVQASQKVLDYLYGTYGGRIYVSMMNQYTPRPGIADQFPELARRVTKREYEKLVDHALLLGMENAFIQEGGTAEESFIPAFDGEGV